MTEQSALPRCAATGVGSLPGTDPLAAITSVMETFPDLPYLPELPGRGVGADVMGRAGGVLLDLPVELAAGRWQVAGRPGADLAVARQTLADDLAALQVAAHGYRGLLKVSLLGPVTLAASLDQALGEVALSDAGLRRDLAESLAEGVRALLADVVARVPDAMPVLQLDEPLLPAVLNGAVRTRSGWGRLDPLDPAEAQTMLAEVLAAGTSARVVHCCAPDIPVQLLLAAGADAVSFDLDLVRDAHLDAYAQAVDAGTHLIVGAVPTSRAISGAETAERVATFWNRLGFSVGTMRERTIVSPSCGMAGLTGDASRAASAVAVQAAQRLAEQDSVAPAG